LGTFSEPRELRKYENGEVHIIIVKGKKITCFAKMRSVHKGGFTMEIGVLGFICWVFFAGCNVFGAMDDGKMIISLLFQSEYMHLSILFDGVVMAVLFAMHCMYGFVPMLIMAFWLFMQMSFTVVALRPRAKDLS
jgi:hypothetical protein